MISDLQRALKLMQEASECLERASQEAMSCGFCSSGEDHTHDECTRNDSLSMRIRWYADSLNTNADSIRSVAKGGGFNI